MTEKEYYEQILCQLQRIGKIKSFESCTVNLNDAAQDLCIQPSDILELVSRDILNVRDSLHMSVYGTDLNRVIKKFSDWLKIRQMASLNNACEHFYDIFPNSWYTDEVYTIQKLHVNKKLLAKASKSPPTPLTRNLVFQLAKNA